MSSSFELTEVAGYRLTERIGSGGMGEVYKAYNAALQREAAVKILHQANLADRFRNEAYIQASVNHPNIARLYEFSTVNNHPCIVMEYVEGETLDEYRHRKGRLSSSETEHIISQVASSLAYLHKKDIIHRDIKPQNFKLKPDGTVKMLDFGIAKHKYSPRLTQTGFVVGTMEYLAPEQFQQQEELKSDVWALAVMTYELLTGYLPFESTNPVSLQAKIRKGSFTNPRILIPEVSDKLLTVIDKSLRVNPANRISAGEIETLLAKKRITSVNASAILNMPARKLVMVGAAAVLIIVMMVFILQKDKPDDEKNIPVIPSAENTGPSYVSDPGSGDGKLTINTPGISNAELILDNGERKSLPHIVEGREGERFRFTIHADGYKDKEIEVQITPRRSSFEYNLEKNP